MVGIKAERVGKHIDDNASDWDEAITQGGWGGTGRKGNDDTQDIQGVLSTTAGTEHTGQVGFILMRDTQITQTRPFLHNSRFGSAFSAGVLFLMGDGSVRNVSFNVAPDIYCWSLNSNDGRSVNLN